MKTSREQAFAEVTQLFLNFRGLTRAEWSVPFAEVEGFMVRLAEEGWTRKDIYTLMNAFHTSEHSVHEECSEAVLDCLDGLVGWVAPCYITRLPGEPTDIKELADHVHNGEWMK
jgi:hypothetical protein